MTLNTALVATAIALTGASGIASAYQPGDWIFRAGIANINPQSDSGAVSIAGGEVAGSGVDVEDNFTVALDIGYMISQRLSVEVLGDLTSKHDVRATGAALGPLGEIVSTRVLPPTLFLNYHFLPNSNIRPYAGVGANYTVFFDEDASSSLEGALGGSTDVDLDPSFGLAAQVGVDVDINDTWFANAVVRYIDIDTEADISSPAGKVTVDVDIDPIVFGVSIGRTFSF